MKSSTVVALVVLVFVTAGVVVWIVLRQTANTLDEAGKTAKTAKDISDNVVELGKLGKKIWTDAGKVFGYDEEGA